MKKQIILVSFLLFIMAISGCSVVDRSQSTVSDAPATSPIPSPTINPEEFYTKPLIYSWGIKENSLIIQDDISLAILGLQLSPEDTKVFYAVEGKDPIQKFKHQTRLTDNNGQISKLRKIIPIYKFKDSEIGIMSFDPRQPGATELYFTIDDQKNMNNGSKSLIAQFSGPSSEDRAFSTYLMRDENSIQLSESQIGFNLWTMNEGQPPVGQDEAINSNPLQESATSTPAPGIQISPELKNKIPSGVAITILLHFLQSVLKLGKNRLFTGRFPLWIRVFHHSNDQKSLQKGLS